MNKENCEIIGKVLYFELHIILLYRVELLSIGSVFVVY
ncbi:hypothetical protein JGUZn3_18770 [Entomobacter blattae]|uniref:Uncharacterized protein n=1 Tax=Entomobacter blattae TaxID=2762277 RepID=A0A7H1NTI1_9PROT|nr:hypothetical protein JGUZn3_18770 [Entomobacter blattae]